MGFFNNAIRIYFIYTKIKNRNLKYLRDYKSLILQIYLIYINYNVYKTTNNKANNLNKKFCVCINTRIIFINNF